MNLIHAIFAGFANLLERSTGGTENRSTHGENPREISFCQYTVLAIDQTLISIRESIDGKIIDIVGQGLHHAAHCSIQCLTVTTACKHSDLHVLCSLPRQIDIILFRVPVGCNGTYALWMRYLISHPLYGCRECWVPWIQHRDS